MKKLKLKKKPLIVGIVLVLIIVLSRLLVEENKIKPINSKDLTKFTIGYETYNLKRNEELTVNAWNDLEIMYNNEIYNSLAIIANGVTIGTKYQDVLKIFDIKEDYAIVNMEVETKEKDGTTDVKESIYKNKNIFKKDYLDLYILFGYKKVNNEWTMITAKELKKTMNSDKELLIFFIDFNGMEDEMVKKGEVIYFSVTHQ